MSEQDKNNNLINILKSVFENYLNEHSQIVLIMLDQLPGILDFICKRSLDNNNNNNNNIDN